MDSSQSRPHIFIYIKKLNRNPPEVPSQLVGEEFTVPAGHAGSDNIDLGPIMEMIRRLDFEPARDGEAYKSKALEELHQQPVVREPLAPEELAATVPAPRHKRSQSAALQASQLRFDEQIDEIKTSIARLTTVYQRLSLEEHTIRTRVNEILHTSAPNEADYNRLHSIWPEGLQPDPNLAELGRRIEVLKELTAKAVARRDDDARRT